MKAKRHKELAALQMKFINFSICFLIGKKKNGWKESDKMKALKEWKL